MSMEHKAYEFDWRAFDVDLRDGLIDALESNNTAGLTSYIDDNIHQLADPYEGTPLETEWRSQLENPDDIHELGDYALTRFYDPTAESGVGDAWLDLDESLPEQCRNAMLGKTVGPKNNPFDPGRMGSYFQSPDGVIQSLDDLSAVDDARLADYLSLLGICRSKNRGVYVTF